MTSRSLPPTQPHPPSASTGQLVTCDGIRGYRIDHVQALPPFLINLVSASDLWMFIASNGALTAGRRDADGALFPYQTADRIYDSAGHIGPLTLLALSTRGGEVHWQPFAGERPPAGRLRRSLTKSVEGDRLWFEEERSDLGLTFSYSWSSADSHGFIRRCRLRNHSPAPVRVRLLDGLRNLLPAGIPSRLQASSSNLADAYKTAALQPDSTLAVYALAATIIDRPIAMEALHASTVWSAGLPGATVLLSDAQLDGFRAGDHPTTETHCRGRRHAYYLTTTVDLEPGEQTEWVLVADTGLSHTAVVNRRYQAGHADAVAHLVAAEQAATHRLRQLVGAADGCQTTGDEEAATHHFANVLFNIMRGGTFAQGHELPLADFSAHVALHNRPVAARQAAWLAALPGSLTRAELLARITPLDDPDLLRIASEYLPLLFSRRHGDPSRPWNRFSIKLRDARGHRRLAYEGNWRDIFQNWEALCLSYPDFLEGVIAKFLNASTADGYNPYRLSQAGIEWEVPDPEDPWSSIGYWGDHQVVYLLKLLEWSHRLHPTALPATLRARTYSYAEVPYHIADYEGLRRDPRNTITFVAADHRALEERAARLGADGRLRTAPNGAVRRANLTEKLLVLTLVRLTNFIPGGGIWMNTQRPEWNDANNALVGYGVSVVTLAYLRRFLAHTRSVLWPALGDEAVTVNAAVAELTQAVIRALRDHRDWLTDPVGSATVRRALVDDLASAGAHYRSRVYRDTLGEPTAIAPSDLVALGDLALAFVDHSLRANRRSDDLFHAYNQLEFSASPAALHLHRLPLMLEGQVAILSSGLLAPEETVNLLRALRTSALYRSDVHSYLLYPDRELPGFLARNIIPPEAATACALLRELEAAGDIRLVQRDQDGERHFQADLGNAEALDQVLDALAAEPAWTSAVARDRAEVHALYEDVFRHRAFTGRSGAMFGFEGLGCIYWHMVAKLLLAVQEAVLAAQAQGSPATDDLVTCYYDVRAGLGFNHSPATFGAFPTDPYSHTPGHAGAQQPGMTGQVKEEVLTRLGELGVRVEAGRVAFAPTFLRALEFNAAPTRFHFLNHAGEEESIALNAQSLGFTFAGVPVCYQRTDGPSCHHIEWHDLATPRETVTGPRLSADASQALLQRSGRIRRIEVELGADYRPRA